MTHTCHWPDCNKPVPPAMWGCRAHWFALPKRLRDRIWATYQPGQEITKTPSAEYLAAAREVQDWIASGAKPEYTPAQERLFQDALIRSLEPK